MSRRQQAVRAWLEQTATPVVILDARRRLVFANRGCTELTGFAVDDLLGCTAEYACGDDSAEARTIANSVCPPADVFDGHTVRVAVDIPHRSGAPVARLVTFHPLTNDEGTVERVLVVMSPIDKPFPPPAMSPSQQLHAELAALRKSLRRRYGFGSLIAGDAKSAGPD